MIPTSVRFAIVLFAAALCVKLVHDGLALPAAASGGLALVLLYNQFRHGRIAAGNRLMDAGLDDEARSSFEGAVRFAAWRGRKAAVSAHLSLAMLDLRRGDHAATWRNLEAAAAYRPGRVQRQPLDLLRAALMIDQQRYEEAVELLIALAAQLPPKRTMTWVQAYLALALLKQGKVAEAVNTITLAIGPAERDKDRYTRQLVFSVAAKVNDAAGNRAVAEEMVRMGVENGLLRRGDREALDLAGKYGFEETSGDG